MEMDDTEKKQLGEDLISASKNGDITRIEALLDTQATSGNISNYRNADGRTPLMHAARYGHLEIVSKLITSGAKVNETDQDGVTALMLAVGRGHIETVSELIESGAIVDAADRDGETALMIAAWRGQLETEVSELIESGATVNKSNKNFETALMAAAWHGHLRIVIELIENGASVDATDKDGDTALMIAARHGHLETVSELVKSGATVDQPNKAGRTALMAAVVQGHAETVGKLIESANVDAVDENGKSALILAAESGHPGVIPKFRGANMDTPNENGRTALMTAACQGSLETVSELIESGASVDTTDKDGRTALLLAAYHGHPETVSRLIASEARVTITDEDGKTALMLAAEGGHPDVITKLVDGKGKWNVNNTDKDGRTALTHAALQGHLKSVNKLIGSGAVVDAEDENGQTALMWAAGSGHLETVSKLIGSGAKVDATNVRGETALMWAAWQGHLEIVRTLIESGASLDVTSKRHYNALDVAIASGNENIAMEIIKNHSWKLAMRNCYHSKSKGFTTTPLRELIRTMPNVAEQVFDQCIVSIGNKVEYNYEFLDDIRDGPPKRSRRCNCWSYLFRPRRDRVHAEAELQPIANHLQNDIDDGEDGAISGGFTNNWGPKGLKQENHPLTIMVKCERVNLLNHPLVTSLINYTWVKVGYSLYYANLAVYLVFLAFLTTFALIVPNPQSCSNEAEMLSEAERLADNTTSLNLSTDCHNLLSDTQTRFVGAAAILVDIFAVVRLVIEVFQLIQLRKQYIQDWVNWLEVAIIVFAITFVTVFNNECPCPQNWQWQVGIVAVFLAWINLAIFMSKLPWVGIYVVMLMNIFKIFLKLIFLSILLLVAFGLPLHMAFFEPGVIRTPFASPARSLLKTITMTTGELGFDEIFRQVPGGTQETDEGLEGIPFPPVSYILWVVFIVTMPILLNNLLVGLAVDDIKNTLKKAELQQLGLKVKLLLTIEELFPGIINHSRTTYQKIQNQEVLQPTLQYTDQLLHQCDEDEDDIMQHMKQLRCQAETLGTNVDHIKQNLIVDEDFKQLQHQTETLSTDVEHIKHQTETLGADINHIKQTLTRLEGYMALKHGITKDSGSM